MTDLERPYELMPVIEEAEKQEGAGTGVSFIGDMVDGVLDVTSVVLDGAMTAGSAVIEGAGDVGGALLDAAPGAAEVVADVVGAIVSGILDS